MKQLLSQLQHVTLQHPYQMLDNPVVRNLVLDNAQLKLSGYGHNISKDYVSLDNWDFIGIHEMCCIEKEGKFVPLMSFKSCPLEVSRKHRVPFPGISSLAAPELTEFKSIAETYVAETEKQGKRITYVGSFTMNPFIKDRKLKALLYKIYMAQCRWHLLSQGMDRIIALAMLQFNTQTSFVKIGFKPLATEQFKAPFLFGQESELWAVDQAEMPNSLIELCDELQPYWQRRWLISAPYTAVEPVLAA